MPELPDAFLRPSNDVRPWVRWWWFGSDLSLKQIVADLSFVARSGFGGVEIAWVYGWPGSEDGPEPLTEPWLGKVAFAVHEAHRLGLECDATFGSGWPFGGPHIGPQNASKRVDGSPTGQAVKRAAPGAEGPVHDHLDPAGFAAHRDKWGALAHLPFRAFFCDSWEVYGRVGDDPFDLADRALTGFYEPFAEYCRSVGKLSRVQAHGAPTDWIAAYATADIPETEAPLIPVEATRLASSAAYLAGKNRVTSESFTCLYGWPAIGQGAERPTDLKAIADAQMARGMQQVVAHGMGSAGRTFYATAALGDRGVWPVALGELNGYLARLSSVLTYGEPIVDVAVWLPLEDDWDRAVALPEGEDGLVGQWEPASSVRRLPPEVNGYPAIWVTSHTAEMLEGKDIRAIVLPEMATMPVSAAERLARLGLPIVALGPVLEKAEWLRVLSGSVPLYRDLCQAGLFPRFLFEGNAAGEIVGRTDGHAEVWFVSGRNAEGVSYPMAAPWEDTLQDGWERCRWKASGPGPWQIWDPVRGLATAPTQTQDEILEFWRHTNESVLLVSGHELPIGTDLSGLGVPLDAKVSMRVPNGERIGLESPLDWRLVPALADYSGPVDYAFEFEVEDLPKWIDLGRIEVVADARLNGVGLGKRIWAPYRWDVSTAIREGTNRLDVTVWNTEFNRLQAERWSTGERRPIPGLTESEWRHVVKNGHIEGPEVRAPSGWLGPLSRSVPGSGF